MAESQTATILVTDLVGSTELRVRLGEERADLLRRTHDDLLRTAVDAEGGTLVKGLGDGVLAMFAGAADAVAAAVAIQQAAYAHNREAPDEPLDIRIGLSAGDVSVEDGDCFGTPVVEASRLCAVATGAQILAAELVRLLSAGPRRPCLHRFWRARTEGLARAGPGGDRSLGPAGAWCHRSPVSCATRPTRRIALLGARAAVRGPTPRVEGDRGRGMPRGVGVGRAGHRQDPTGGRGGPPRPRSRCSGPLRSLRRGHGHGLPTLRGGARTGHGVGPEC